MSQQTANSNTDSNASGQASAVEPLSLSEAIWQLPRQYIRVLIRPSAQTFYEEMGKASWGMVFLQFYALIVITIALSYLAHFIPSASLHTTSTFSIGSFKPFAFLPSPYNGIAFILGSFLIGLITAYFFSRLWGGQGRFLEHVYSLLLCTIPLVTISGALLLLPPVGLLLIALVLLLFVYRMVLHIFIIMGVHGLSSGKAGLIVLIIPMLVIGLVLVLLTEGKVLEGLSGASDWFPAKSEKRNSTQSRTKWK